MPIIIVEGVDGSGKTTLISLIEKAIPKHFQKHFHHCGPLTGTVEQEYYDPLTRVRFDTFFVGDRWHVGEMIYGPIYRGESKVTKRWKNDIEDLLDRRGSVKVIMKPGLDVVTSRLKERGEDYLQDEHVKEVYDFYDIYAKDNGYILVEETQIDLLESVAADLVGLAVMRSK